MAENLVSGLSGEIERVALKAQRWRDWSGRVPGAERDFALPLMVMDATLAAARDALKSGDIPTMMSAYVALKDYSDDD